MKVLSKYDERRRTPSVLIEFKDEKESEDLIEEFQSCADPKGDCFVPKFNDTYIMPDKMLAELLIHDEEGYYNLQNVALMKFINSKIAMEKVKNKEESDE